MVAKRLGGFGFSDRGGFREIPDRWPGKKVAEQTLGLRRTIEPLFGDRGVVLRIRPNRTEQQRGLHQQGKRLGVRLLINQLCRLGEGLERGGGRLARDADGREPQP